MNLAKLLENTAERVPQCGKPYDKKTKPRSIGLPIPGFEAHIVDESDRDLEPGQVGELVVKGPGVMMGYLNRPEEKAKTLVNGWLHTGEMACMDDEDYIYIVDRKKDMITKKEVT